MSSDSAYMKGMCGLLVGIKQHMWEGLIIPYNVCVIHYHITNLWPLKEERSFGVLLD